VKIGIEKISRHQFLSRVFRPLGLCLLAAAFLAVGGYDASASPKPLRILFIGNSFTYVNMLPEMIRQMSLAANDPHPAQYRMIAPGSCTLEKHWNDGVAPKAIAEGGWDYVVLQEQSARPISDPAGMFRFARLFDQEIRKTGAKTVFYITWARKAAPNEQKQITAAYSAIAKELGALSCPVGPAWASVRQKRPDLELYQVDGRHPSPAGTYMAACVFYHLLYGKSPVGLPGRLDGDNGRNAIKTLVDLSKMDATLLQQTAVETLKQWEDGRTPP
jgi:hypothetical protein